jgi:hypothetical protein
MNNTKKLRSALLSSLTIIASIVLGHTAQAQVNIYFEPEGNQLDNRDDDPILDISVGHLPDINFDIFISIDQAFFGVNQLEYKVEFDSQELNFNAANGAQGLVKEIKHFKIDPDTKVGSFTVSNLNALGIAPFQPGNPQQPPVKITTITFVPIGQLPSDGIFDFKISDAKGADANGAVLPFRYGPNNNNNAFSQKVEVQTPEPTSILGLFSLGIIGAGATIKRQVKRNHSIEKETTEIG